MHQHVCPWWIGLALASPFRRVFYDPRAVLEPYVHPGMTILEPGPGMGFFTIEMARMVGTTGKVIAIDLQKQMLARLRLRAARAGVAERVEVRLAEAESMHIGNLEGKVDFVLAFAMVHEVPDRRQFFGQLIKALRHGGKLLISEPNWHVSRVDFENTLDSAQWSGFKIDTYPKIKTNKSVLMVKE